MELLLAGLGALGAAAWFGLGLQGLVAWLRVPLLSQQEPQPPATWPSVAIVVAARDEVGVIEPALRSLLALDYPALEVVVVDDRSTDGTRDVLRSLAAEEPRLTVATVDELPDGWLGKTHALHVGTGGVEATWVLYTDADVHMAPDLLRRALGLAAAHDLDHLTMVPRFIARTPLLGAWLAAFTDGYVGRGRGRSSVVLGERSATFGYGAFNLVRRSALSSSEGLPWLRMDVLDDLALGEVLRRAGARRGFLLADIGLEIEWYPTLRDALRTLEKNAFGALASYRLWRAAAFALLVGLVLVAGPVLALANDRWTLWPLLVAALVVHVVAQVVATVRSRRPLVHGLLSPLAIVAMAPAVVRATAVTLRLGGVRWRETVYPLEELKAGQRVTFP